MLVGGEIPFIDELKLNAKGLVFGSRGPYLEHISGL